MLRKSNLLEKTLAKKSRAIFCKIEKSTKIYLGRLQTFFRCKKIFLIPKIFPFYDSWRIELPQTVSSEQSPHRAAPPELEVHAGTTGSRSANS
jgi:hypothetical protein